MSKVYAITEIGYEYNDEGYYRQEGDGNVLNVWKSLSDAIQEAQRLTIEDIKNGNLQVLYNYDYSSAVQNIAEILECEIDDDDYTLIALTEAFLSAPPSKQKETVEYMVEQEVLYKIKELDLL